MAEKLQPQVPKGIPGFMVRGDDPAIVPTIEFWIKERWRLINSGILASTEDVLKNLKDAESFVAIVRDIQPKNFEFPVTLAVKDNVEAPEPPAPTTHVVKSNADPTISAKIFYEPATLTNWKTTTSARVKAKVTITQEEFAAMIKDYDSYLEILGQTKTFGETGPLYLYQVHTDGNGLIVLTGVKLDSPEKVS